MMPAFKSRIENAVKERKAQGLNRALRPLLSGNQTEIEFDGHRYINFSNNDYLGLANDASLVKRWQEGLSLYGAGSGSSPLVTGFCSAHQNLEQQLCEWLGYERAILLNSGFSANQAVLFSLLEEGDKLFQDKLNHASLIEAGMLSPALMRRFAHNDIDHLNTMLDEHTPSLIVTEGVFSMDGDRAPLSALNQVVEQHDNALLMVDDAHGVGICGSDGGGSCQLAGVHPDILIVTFGKAFGMAGAAILCSQAMGEYLTQFARHHVYSTAMPPAQAYALSYAVTLIQSQYWRREKLAELQQIYQEKVGHFSSCVATETPIKPFIIGSSEQAMYAAKQMQHRGLWVTAIRPPTVPAKRARLRITLTAAHSPEQVRSLCNGLNQVMELLDS